MPSVTAMTERVGCSGPVESETGPRLVVCLRHAAWPPAECGPAVSALDCTRRIEKISFRAFPFRSLKLEELFLIVASVFQDSR